MINFKKITIITSEFPPEPGGIGNHAYNIAKYLAINKYKVSVITDQRLNDRQNEILFDSNLLFKVVRVKKQSIRVLMYLNRIFQIFKHTYRNEIIIASGKFPLWIVAITSLFFKVIQSTYDLIGQITFICSSCKCGNVFFIVFRNSLTSFVFNL